MPIVRQCLRESCLRLHVQRRLIDTIDQKLFEQLALALMFLICGDLVAITTYRRDAERMGAAAQNMVVMRHIALNLLRQEASKASLKTKLLRAALNDAYLAWVREL